MWRQAFLDFGLGSNAIPGDQIDRIESNNDFGYTEATLWTIHLKDGQTLEIRPELYDGHMYEILYKDFPEPIDPEMQKLMARRARKRYKQEAKKETKKKRR